MNQNRWYDMYMILNSKIGLTFFGILVVVVCAYIVITQEKQQVIYESSQTTSLQVVDQKPIRIVASSTPTKSKQTATNKMEGTYSNEPVDVFADASPEPGTSNVVGYFARGGFVISVPQWIVAYWGNGPFKDDLGSLSFTPRYEVGNHDFSDINIYIRPTDELFNAEWLYSQDKKSATESEIYFNTRKDMQVYFLKRVEPTRTYLTFYIDGNNKTGKVTFDASNENISKYIPKIKEFVSSMGTGREVLFDK